MKSFKSKGWDNLFKNDINRWKKPNKYVFLFVKKLRKIFKNHAKVLDIGFGTGRHINYLGKSGFKVFGFDIVKNSKKYVKFKNAKLRIFDMNKFPWPYKSNSFQGVLAINVIHHTNYRKFVKIIKQIHIVLIPNGLLMATIASKDNHKCGIGKKIDNYTYITDSGAEKGIPHCFFDEYDLRKILNKKFNILKLKKIRGEIPDADKKLRKKDLLDHWCVYVQKK